MRSSPNIFCDFDGTITRADITDRVLAEFGKPGWREVEREWVSGRIGSRECLERQMSLVRASAQELDALIDSVPVDPYFLGLYRAVKRRGIPFYIVSDGFDYWIRRVLGRSGIRKALRNGKDFFASALLLEQGRLRVSFPYSNSGCTHRCATCKVTVMRRLAGTARKKIFIGDGLSDRFAVQEADLILAKGALRDYCQEQGITFRPFRTFENVERALEDWLEWDRSKLGLPPSAGAKTSTRRPRQRESRAELAAAALLPGALV